MTSGSIFHGTLGCLQTEDGRVKGRRRRKENGKREKDKDTRY